MAMNDISTLKSAPPSSRTKLRNNILKNVFTGFTVSEIDEIGAPPQVIHAIAVLRETAALIQHFPEYNSVVVNVARKTDSSMWPILFRATGKASQLFQVTNALNYRV